MARLTSELIVRLIDQVSGPARGAQASIRGLTRSIRDANAQEVRAYGRQARDDVRRLSGELVGAAATATALGFALASPIRTAMELESGLADIRKVVEGLSDEDLAGLRRGLIDMSRRLPVSAKGLAAIAAAAGQAGVAKEDLLEFTEQAAKMGIAFDMSADQAGEAMAGMMAGLKMNVKQVAILTDAMNLLANTQASTEADILEVMTRVGAESKNFGLAPEQTAALASAMLSAKQAPEVVATSIRNVGKALTRGESATKRQRRAFEALGLEAVETSKRMQEDAVGTIMDVIARLQKLPAHMRAAVSSDLLGDEVRAFQVLINNAELLEQSFGLVAQKARYLGATQKEYEARAKTTANNWQLMKNRATALAISVGSALLPAFNDVLAILGPLANDLSRFADQHPGLIRLIVGTTVALVGLRLALIAARLAKAATIVTIVDLVGAYGAAKKAARGLAMFLIGPFIRAHQRSRVQARLMAMEMAAASASGLAGKKGLAGFAAGLIGLLNPMRLVRLGITALKWTVRGFLAATGIGLILLAAGWIVENWSNVLRFFKGFAAGFMEAVKPVKPVIDPIVAVIKELVGWIAQIVGPSDSSAEAWEAWGRRTGGAIGDVITKMIQAIHLAAELGKAAYKFQSAPARMGGAAGAAVAGAHRSRMAAARREAGGGMPAGMGGGFVPPVRAGRAKGGHVKSGELYEVIEDGSEIFRPGKSGTIYPNRELQKLGGGGQVINIYQTNNNTFQIYGSSPRETYEMISREQKKQARADANAAFADLPIRG